MYKNCKDEDGIIYIQYSNEDPFWYAYSDLYFNKYFFCFSTKEIGEESNINK